jgi:hypothetical protein
VILAASALGAAPARPPVAPATASRPAATSAVPKNLDAALQNPMKIDADAVPLGSFVRSLSDLTQTNIAFNWNALEKAGITRDTPVTLHLKEVPYEHVVRTLLEILPARNQQERANFVVADNTLEVTTNADLGKTLASKLYDLSRTLSYTFNARATAAEVDANRALVEKLVLAELARAGEPMDVKGHELHSKETTLAATISEHGLTIVDRCLGLLAQPAKIGQLPPGIQMTAMAKRADTAFKAAVAALPTRDPGMQYLTLAREPQKYNLNIALLPGTADELAKPAPQIAGAISDGGVLLLGPKSAIAARTLMGVYDLRDLIKKIAIKSGKNPPPDAVQEAILQTLKSQIKPDGGWGAIDDLNKSTAVLVPYNGIMIVVANQDLQRTVAGALQDMNK